MGEGEDEEVYGEGRGHGGQNRPFFYKKSPTYLALKRFVLKTLAAEMGLALGRGRNEVTHPCDAPRQRTQPATRWSDWSLCAPGTTDLNLPQRGVYSQTTALTTALTTDMSLPNCVHNRLENRPELPQRGVYT